MLIAFDALHGEVKILAFGRRADAERCAKAEDFDQLGFDLLSGGRGEGEDGGAAQGVGGEAELGVGGAEVVAPLADAVGFVDHEECAAVALQERQEGGVWRRSGVT